MHACIYICVYAYVYMIRINKLLCYAAQMIENYFEISFENYLKIITLQHYICATSFIPYITKESATFRNRGSFSESASSVR